MRVLALVPNKLGFAPGQRTAIEAWLPALLDAGIEVDFFPFETEELNAVLYSRGGTLKKSSEMIGSLVDRVRLLGSLSDYDVVYVYREAALIGPEIFETFVSRFRKIRMVYSLDDPLFVPYRSPFQGRFTRLKFFGKVKRICAMSDQVIVNSTYLAAWARQYNSRVAVVPSIVDVPKDVSEILLRRKEPIVGWSGSPTTAPNLEMIASPLEEIQRRFNVPLHFIGGREYPELDGLDYVDKSWSQETEVEDLSAISIGLVPMPDNPWNRWKFSLKVAQYMSLGIPSVATPIGDIPMQIAHERNGFLAESTSDWVNCLSTLITSRDRRADMGAIAHKFACDRYSLQANRKQILKAFGVIS